jgi:hypothetical protein
LCRRDVDLARDFAAPQIAGDDGRHDSLASIGASTLAIHGGADPNVSARARPGKLLDVDSGTM